MEEDEIGIQVNDKKEEREEETEAFTEVVVSEDTTTSDQNNKNKKTFGGGRERRLSLIQNPISPEHHKYNTIESPTHNKKQKKKMKVYEEYNEALSEQQRDKRKSLLKRATDFVTKAGNDGYASIKRTENLDNIVKAYLYKFYTPFFFFSLAFYIFLMCLYIDIPYHHIGIDISLMILGFILFIVGYIIGIICSTIELMIQKKRSYLGAVTVKDTIILNIYLFNVWIPLYFICLASNVVLKYNGSLNVYQKHIALIILFSSATLLVVLCGLASVLLYIIASRKPDSEILTQSSEASVKLSSLLFFININVVPLVILFGVGTLLFAINIIPYFWCVNIIGYILVALLFIFGLYLVIRSFVKHRFKVLYRILGILVLGNAFMWPIFFILLQLYKSGVPMYASIVCIPMNLWAIITGILAMIAFKIFVL